jgi:hypothetical protein
MPAAIGRALMMSFTMAWEILWALILANMRGCKILCNVRAHVS